MKRSHSTPAAGVMCGQGPVNDTECQQHEARRANSWLTAGSFYRTIQTALVLENREGNKLRTTREKEKAYCLTRELPLVFCQFTCTLACLAVPTWHCQDTAEQVRTESQRVRKGYC